MMEESAASIWASMHSWFTPTVLFFLINVVIGTIFFSSSKHQPDDDTNKNPKPLSRASSVLQRLRSFNLHRQNTQDLTPLTATLDPHQPIQTVERSGPEEPEKPGAGEERVVVGEESDPQPAEEKEFDQEGHFARSRSDNHPTSGFERLEKLAEKLKKSASAKPVFGHFEEGEILEAVQRPATTRERKVAGEDDEEVDAKADDFINKFKEQLKLQRLDSIDRYKQMLNRGK